MSLSGLDGALKDLIGCHLALVSFKECMKGSFLGPRRLDLAFMGHKWVLYGSRKYLRGGLVGFMKAE